MQSIIRNVRDIDAADREALEQVVGRKLGENQQVIINVVDLDVTAPSPKADGSAGGRLPEWCNVYEGLTDAEIEDIEKSIVRSHESRSFD